MRTCVTSLYDSGASSITSLGLATRIEMPLAFSASSTSCDVGRAHGLLLAGSPLRIHSRRTLYSSLFRELFLLRALPAP